MRVKDFWDFVRFWESLPDRRLQGDEKRRAQVEARASVLAMADPVREAYRSIIRERFDEQDAIRADVAGRASQLLLFVGVVSTGATIVAGSFESTVTGVTISALVVGALLLYSCLAVAWLAVRAQEVQQWTRPGIGLDTAKNLPGLRVHEVAETYVSTEQNSAVVRNLVAYLRDAQLWARIAILLVVVLAVLSVAAAAT